jgi:cyclopropane fatty-acyl-phospholipid synthase-like methyltransferase
MDKSKIAKYYDYTLPFYRYFWHKDSESYAIHYGFWGKGVKSHKESLMNTNKFLAEKVKIKRDNIVLDAGCGIGGSAIWMAKNFKAHVVGISLSEKQIQKARDLARINNVGHLTKFYVKDFLNTGFPNGSFDIVWAIESVCHAENKKDFLMEAFRLLKKSGKIIVADGFLKRDAENDKEKQMIKDFIDGLALPNVDKIDQFRKSLEEVGFKNIKFWDKTREVSPSSKKLYNMCRIGYPIAKITEKLKITPELLVKNNLAGIVQHKAVKIGLGGYGVFYGEK